MRRNDPSLNGLSEWSHRLVILAEGAFFRGMDVVPKTWTVCGVLVFCLLFAVHPVAGQLNEVTVSIERFVNLSGVEDERWIGIGIADSVAADLLVSGNVRVLMTEQEGTAVGEDSDWLLTGNYQRLGSSVRIIGQLTYMLTGVVQVVKLDGELDDLFLLQDQLGAEIWERIQNPRLTVTTQDSGGAEFEATAPRPPDQSASRPDPVDVDMAVSSVTEAGAVSIDGPAPPMPPAVINRDSAGRATVRAQRLRAPLNIDGTLDESFYTEVEAWSDFVQQEPDEGAPATEKTEVWVSFDESNVYVSARAWDSAPESQWVVNEMRRDNFNILRNEGLHISFDTFYDRRNGVIFNVTPIGGRMDGQVTDERLWNGDWNPIWEVQTGRFDDGWTMEAAIPFQSLRYRAGRSQTWGFNARRVVRWKNEMSSLTQLPAARGLPGQFMQSLSATLVGLEAPVRTRGTFELKPYAISEVAGTQLVDLPGLANVATGDVGFDVKYGLTQNLVADVTVNTDFAQVEADEQQVNLTRFSLFFPEKREFFLENQGVFAFGGSRSGGTRGGGTDTPVLFYSREIGLDGGQEVPMDVGGRITGRVGRFNVGLMNIQTGDVPGRAVRATNFTVARLRRDILRRSNIGFLYTGRSVSKSGLGSSQSYGVDGVFSFFDSLNINTYWATTDVPGQGRDDLSYKAELDYDGDRYGVKAERLVVGADFAPEVGFLRRDNFDRRFGLFRFSPRPARIASIRKLTFQGQVAYVLDRVGLLESRENQGQFGVELENADTFDLTYTRSYEFLKRPFGIAAGVRIPVGGYGFQDAALSYTFGPQRLFAGMVSLQHGTFYHGDKTTLSLNRSRIEITPQLSIEPGLSYNRVSLPEASFVTNLVTTRTTYTVTPLMFVSALLQYNSSMNSLSANVRLRWEYRPGSELFVVYNEERDTLVPNRFTQPENRAFIVKFNRLFRF